MRSAPCRTSILTNWSPSTRLQKWPLQVRPALSSGNLARPLAHRRFAPHGLDRADDERHRPFRGYFDQAPAPTLLPGDIVVMDNLPAHNGISVRAAIQARSATSLLPLYSPDLQPDRECLCEFISRPTQDRRQNRPMHWKPGSATFVGESRCNKAPTTSSAQVMVRYIRIPSSLLNL